MAHEQPYIVRQGDYVAKIAAEVGCSEDEIWALNKNAELKDAGRARHVLHPGDVLFVPAKGPPRTGVELEGANSFHGNVPRVHVRVRFREDEKACVGRRYRVLDAGEPVQGETDSEGTVACNVPVTVRFVRVVFEDPPAVFVVDVGSVDPATELSGVRCRLRQLGYLPLEPGAADVSDEDLASALKTFQARCGLEPTGVADEETAQRLRKEFGGA